MSKSMDQTLTDRSILDKLPKREINPFSNERPRRLRDALKDAWMAFRGKTFVTMRGHCFHCDKTFHVECYQDCLFPIRPRCGCTDPVSLDMMHFNGSGYFPLQLMKENPTFVYEAKTGDHLTVEESRELEQRLGYGKNWWEENTLENIKNRHAVRTEHKTDES